MTPIDSIPIVEEPVADHELLRRYAAGGPGAQAAFASLVSRHLDFVYSVAVRQVRDRHLAEDVTQAVFLVLARKAGRMNGRLSGQNVEKQILLAWLFQVLRVAAARPRRTEGRRRKHERQAAEAA